jgi:hypothetical protein
MNQGMEITNKKVKINNSSAVKYVFALNSELDPSCCLEPHSAVVVVQHRWSGRFPISGNSNRSSHSGRRQVQHG